MGRRWWGQRSRHGRVGLFLKGLRLALAVYALTCALALGWAVYESPTWLEVVLRAAVPLMIAGYAFTGRVRERLG